MNFNQLTFKVDNDGATPEGKLSAEEYNALLLRVQQLSEGATYGGIVTPASNPISIEPPVFYVAMSAGTYTNFGGLIVADGEVAILQIVGNAWTKTTLINKGEFMAATPSGNPNHNLYTSLGAVWSDAGWELNGVPLTNEEIDVSYLCSVPYLHRIQEHAWSNMPNYFTNRFKTNFCSLLGTAYNTPQRAFNANSIGYTATQLQVVRFQSLGNETLYKVFINNPLYMFGYNPKLREIQDYLDVSLCTSFTSAFGARATSLETIWLIGLNADIDISGTSVFKKECLLYMIQKAAPTKAITIKVNADVAAWASTDPDIITALELQPLVTLTV